MTQKALKCIFTFSFSFIPSPHLSCILRWIFLLSQRACGVISFPRQLYIQNIPVTFQIFVSKECKLMQAFMKVDRIMDAAGCRILKIYLLILQLWTFFIFYLFSMNNCTQQNESFLAQSVYASAYVNKYGSRSRLMIEHNKQKQEIAQLWQRYALHDLIFFTEYIYIKKNNISLILLQFCWFLIMPTRVMKLFSGASPQLTHCSYLGKVLYHLICTNLKLKSLTKSAGQQVGIVCMYHLINRTASLVIVYTAVVSCSQFVELYLTLRI